MFVQRDSLENIVAVFANAQPGIAEEWVEGAVVYVTPPSFQKALADLNAEYQANIQKLNVVYSMAILVDGSSEAAKVVNIRAQYSARKDLHTANVAALKLEYGV
jgi:hypothetical protein